MNLFQPSSSPVHSVSFDVRDRGLLLADGVFDTSLVVRERIILREAHINRLLDGAVALGIPLQRSQVAQAMDLGLFGAPSFIAEGDVFWGDDRLENAIAHLKAG